MAGSIASIDPLTFLVFIIAVIVWIGLGSWGASIITQKNYLAPDSPQVAHGSDVVRRMGPISASPQMVLAVLGPIILVVAVILPRRS